MPIDANGRFIAGLATTRWLADIGITSIHEVQRMGVIETCLRLRAAGHRVSLTMAYSLQADLMGTTWNRVPAAVKTDLAEAYRAALANRR